MDETIETINPHKAIAFIQENANAYSIAKGSRIESEHLLKTVKAILMNEESGSVASKEAYALSHCLLYTSPSPRDRTRSRMPSSA